MSVQTFVSQESKIETPTNLKSETFMFPFKERGKRIETFDIPVYDSERAGLGVSVKGKTTSPIGIVEVLWTLLANI